MFIKNTILQNLKHEPTSSQVAAIENITNYLYDKKRESIYILKGYAGTGKTSLISSITNTLLGLNKKVILMAPTGRAAKVLSNYSSHPASTIHKCIYKKETTKNIDSPFVLNYKKYNNTVFIVDESSLISNNNNDGNNTFGSGRLLEDLLDFVMNNDNCKLFLVGDSAQLPPVNASISPALDTKYLESIGYNCYQTELTDVVRQSFDSGILTNATILRNSITNNKCDGFIKLVTNAYPDIFPIFGNELQEYLEDSFSKYGIEETKIITKSNKYANNYNQGLRSQILWKEEEISIGDLLMVVKNNYSWLDEKSPIDFIANGDIVKITRVRNIQEVYNHRYADISIQFIDYPLLEIDVKVLLDTLTSETASIDNNYYSELYNQLQIDYQDITDSSKRHETILKDAFYNALQIKFAYAITCHKSQGGQWDSVFIDYGWFTEEMLGYDFYRWLYTAITRSKEKLYLVNFDKKFLEED